MYAPNSQQAVNMRGLAARLRRRAQETDDGYYRRLMQYAAQDLEVTAERLERAGWKPPLH